MPSWLQTIWYSWAGVKWVCVCVCVFVCVCPTFCYRNCWDQHRANQEEIFWWSRRTRRRSDRCAQLPELKVGVGWIGRCGDELKIAQVVCRCRCRLHIGNLPSCWKSGTSRCCWTKRQSQPAVACGICSPFTARDWTLPTASHEDVVSIGFVQFPDLSLPDLYPCICSVDRVWCDCATKAWQTQ